MATSWQITMVITCTMCCKNVITHKFQCSWFGRHDVHIALETHCHIGVKEKPHTSETVISRIKARNSKIFFWKNSENSKQYSLKNSFKKNSAIDVFLVIFSSIPRQLVSEHLYTVASDICQEIQSEQKNPVDTGRNWTYIRRSEDVLDVFWTSYVRSIYVRVYGEAEQSWTRFFSQNC